MPTTNPYIETVAAHTRADGTPVRAYQRARRGCRALALQWEARRAMPIAQTLAEMGIDRSEGRNWRRSGRHPALRFTRAA